LAHCLDYNSIYYQIFKCVFLNSLIKTGLKNIEKLEIYIV